MRRRTSFSAVMPVLVLGACLVASGCGGTYGQVANLGNAGEAIVCFGDSITRGYGVPADQAYPVQLSLLLNRPVINAGRDGDTTGSALGRLERDVLSLRPRLVIVELGGNDLLNRVPREETASNLDRIVGRCVASGCMVVLVHAKFGIWSDPFAEAFEEVAERHGAVVVWKSLSGILGNTRMMHDQIHPNADGYRLLAERVAAVVEPLLAEADKQREENAPEAVSIQGKVHNKGDLG